ncbi:MAG: hypothetical protein MRECE_12c038 [Mycoplasmataceae bacterium CE_OT135]|nr:MAG: hypothetical protein MRECE_12c038 [Mycoplasmataceae bacterium CE_OT135]
MFKASGVIILISLILAVGAAYWFLQWKCPTKQEKLTQIMEQTAAEEVNNDLDFANLTPAEIKKMKSELAQEIKKTQALQKKSGGEELSEKEEQDLAELPHALEAQSLLCGVEKKEDFQKKVYSYWDWGYAVGLALVVFLVSQFLGNLMVKKVKGEGE